MNSCDIMLVSGDDPISLGIQLATRSRWSHAQLVEKWPMVISADADGVIHREVKQEELKTCAFLRYWGLSRNQSKAILEFAHSCVGKSFDYLGMFLYGTKIDIDESWFCSELVFQAYLKAGIRLLKRVEKTEVQPAYFWVSPLLDLVEGGVL